MNECRTPSVERRAKRLNSIVAQNLAKAIRQARRKDFTASYACGFVAALFATQQIEFSTYNKLFEWLADLELKAYAEGRRA